MSSACSTWWTWMMSSPKQNKDCCWNLSSEAVPSSTCETRWVLINPSKNACFQLWKEALDEIRGLHTLSIDAQLYRTGPSLVALIVKTLTCRCVCVCVALRCQQLRQWQSDVAACSRPSSDPPWQLWLGDRKRLGEVVEVRKTRGVPAGTDCPCRCQVFNQVLWLKHSEWTPREVMTNVFIY